MKPFILFVACLSFLLSCSGGNSNSPDNHKPADTLKVSTYETSFEKGKVIPKITCLQDTSLSYAVYLPGNYSPETKSPIIYCFDSHGSGAFPLEMYKGLAEQYGFILVGSNNSKNGMNWEQNHPQIKIFMDDVKKRFHTDPKRIYTCGFSGGSRVACSIAIFDGGVNCVIGMGAGLPSITEPIHNRFDYIGYAGNEDFNMNEMIALNASLDKAPIRHQLIIFNGKHEWAPVESAEDAFLWLQVNAMKDGLISKNDTLLKHFISKSENEAAQFKHDKQYYSEYLLRKKMVNYLDGLSDVTELKAKLEEISKSEDLKKELDRKEKLAKEEMALQESYRSNFVLWDVPRWTAELAKLREKPKAADKEMETMKKRLLGFLSVLAYMNVNAAFESKQYDMMEKFLKIYQIIDPENPEHQYLFADLYIIKKDNSKAILSLQNAVKLGFDDLNRLEADPYLSTLISSQGYQDLISKLRGKQ